MEDQKENVVLMPARETRFVYYGKQGWIVDRGIERLISELTESERVEAGEAVLRRISDDTGVPVSKLRKEVGELALKAGPKPPPRLQIVKTQEGKQRPMLVVAGANRKQRRAERKGNR